VPYEAGSVFKPIAMAAALDTHSLTPYTTYTDTGSVVYGQYVIRNSDGKAHGKRTMIDVLDKSLNTGIVFAMRQAGAEVFKEYVKRFGFGKLTGIELANESPGNIKNFEDKREIYAATAAFGQGIAVTPIQLVTAYAVIARGGTLVKPTVIEKITDWNKDIIFGVKELEQVISQETAETLSAMLVSGTKNGYAKTGAVRGYKIAAKTGTAQIPKSDGKGYSEETNHTFIGFGPVGSGKPVFVMLVKLDKPKGVKFADSSIAPLFRELAEFLLSYLEIPPTE
jgi:cell division protein FtsI/penicillin-binding protein 2